ncbi:PH domain-containing protein [Flaviflexus huanghaiensis]|uniref:PH domain-containing protein n=1 Tax=Flaviflexus huanghaiensis TaxID=1111473 RepID=UPI0015F96111|nr:PH domain-containing protein [Flaviflexus huanghaiensis]
MARYVTAGLAVLLIASTAVLFAMAPSFGIYAWGTVDYIGTVILLAFFLWLLWIQYQVRVEVRDEGIYIKNLIYAHSLEWGQIVGVDFGEGPWVRIDTTDGHVVSVMAIQSADGDYARREAVRLATLIDRKQSA